ncbi:hypothetical protein [Novosphingobium panipatense]|nr:hypothetical protein [Novosphingobium panipatense]
MFLEVFRHPKHDDVGAAAYRAGAQAQVKAVLLCNRRRVHHIERDTES